ncbi:MAG: alkyl/aryl-sulfatase [Acidimicrobiia bacterium]
MTDATRKQPSASTASVNAAAAALVPTDPDDFEAATRGRVAPLPGPVVHPTFGHAVWDPADWAFLDGEAPASVHPSLWRQARLNAIHGLFRVADGVFQVRGVDLSNITFIAGDTGWIVIDPLTASETAAFALELLHAHEAARPVVAVVYTHSHVDHFGGVRGVVTDEAVAAGEVAILAPVGFLEAAIAENVVAGPAMLRRASYMYGRLLPGDALGHVDCGLGKAIPLIGTSGLIVPTVEITHTGEERVVDGVRLRFQYTPDTEAPAEMNIFLPDRRLLCMAENCSSTLHNVYTPRGAQIRDALAWSKYIDEAIELFAADTDTVFTSHHWPRFGAPAVRRFMEEQRDTYRWIHDETMRRANHGATALEIAEELGPPPGLEDRAHVRGYYGTLSHNAKAVYQRYLGWFDANPAHLEPLPPVDAARRYVEFMGGADAVLEKVAGSIAAGDYRWAAQVLDHVVFAEPDRTDARLLQADVLEQLGYRAESGPWRDFYLTGAQELRNGVPHLGGSMASSVDVLRAMTTEMLVDLMGVRLDGGRAAPLVMNLSVTDRDERGVVGVAHGALRFTPGRHDDAATVGLAIVHLALARLASGLVTLADLDPADATVTGDRAALERFLATLDTFDASFPIVTP